MADGQRERDVNVLFWAIFAFVFLSFIAYFYSFIFYPSVMPKKSSIIMSNKYKVEEIRGQQISQKVSPSISQKAFFPEEVVPSSQKAEYSLEIGPIVFKSKLEEIKKKLEEIGIKPEVFTSKEKVDYNRVMIGHWKGRKGALSASKKLRNKGYNPMLMKGKGGLYSLAIGVFFYEKNARKVRKELERLGYSPAIDKISLTKDVYRVRASISSDEKKLRVYLEKLQREGIGANLERVKDADR